MTFKCPTCGQMMREVMGPNFTVLNDAARPQGRTVVMLTRGPTAAPWHSSCWNQRALRTLRFEPFEIDDHLVVHDQSLENRRDRVVVCR
jgi:hypothetical protein